MTHLLIMQFISQIPFLCNFRWTKNISYLIIYLFIQACKTERALQYIITNWKRATRWNKTHCYVSKSLVFVCYISNCNTVLLPNILRLFRLGAVEIKILIYYFYCLFKNMLNQIKKNKTKVESKIQILPTFSSLFKGLDNFQHKNPNYHH